MEPFALFIMLAGIALSHLLGGIAAFGSTMLALPALIWFLDINDARTILLLVGTVQSYQMLFYVHQDVSWRLLGRMVFFAGLGLPVGICALHYLPEKPLIIALGILLIISGANAFRRQDYALKSRWPSFLLDGLLFFGGIIHGAFVCGGPALVVYVQHMAPEKAAFRGTLCAFWALVNTILIIILLCGDTPIAPVMPVLITGTPVVILMSLLGNRAAGRMSQQFFCRVVATLLIISGTVSIGRALQ